MKVLVVSDMLIGAHLSVLLRQEGHDVRLHIINREYKGCFENLVEKTTGRLEDALAWVGKEGLIVFDDVGHGRLQDRLRKQGYTVFGGSEVAEKLENDREFGQKVFSEHGLQTVPLHTFSSYRKAISFVEKNPGKWVLKFNSTHLRKSVMYIGEQATGKDVISILKSLEKSTYDEGVGIVLQSRIEGVEIGVARYFNGSEWVGPVEYSIEHTRMFPGDLGPLSDEMGSIVWFDYDLEKPMYQRGLNSFSNFLKEANFRGDFSLNFIVNKNGLYPIDATARIGSPEVHLHTEMMKGNWFDLLHAVASGHGNGVRFKTGFGVLVSIVVPPFPYVAPEIGKTMLGIPIDLSHLSSKELKKVHFEEVSSHDGTDQTLYIAGPTGYVMYVTDSSELFSEAQKNVYDIIDRIHIPRMFYRGDIGARFMSTDYSKLRKWNYL